MKISSFVLALAASASIFAVATGATAQDTRTAATNRALGTCDGFAQEAVLTNTQNAAAATTSGVFVTMPSTVISGGGSGGGIDLYTVTLSGEASAAGGGSYEVQAQVSINGGRYINMHPSQPNTFHSGNFRQTHTMTWCREIDASSTTFRIVWRKVGGGTAYIDDYVMRVERSS